MSRVGSAVLVLAIAGCVVEYDIGRAERVGTDSGTSHGSESGAESSGSGGPVCEPEPDAGACGQCEAELCCAESLACAAEPICECLVPCLLAGHSPAACETDCGIDHGESSDLLHCLTQSCASECGP